MNLSHLPPEIEDLSLDPARPLVIVDVDEVLAMFMQGFERFIVQRGLEMRLDRFALFQAIFRPGESEHLDLATGRALFDEFFFTDVEHMEPTPGGPGALSALALHGQIVILTNAPQQSRLLRGRWLAKHDMDYPLVLNTGPKGPAAAALAAKTRGPVAFIDDLLPNLDSVADEVEGAHTFQMVADHRLRQFAPSAPDRHTRIDDWAQLGPAIESVIRRP